MKFDEILEQLKTGNKNFMAGAVPSGETATVRRLLTVEGQTPKVTVFTCSDSRVPPEMLLGQSIGDIFTVRTAGHVLDESSLGSLEYAVGQLKTPLLIVLGHSSCGAVHASMAKINYPGALGFLQKIIRSSIQNEKDMHRAILRHTAKTVQTIIYRSPLIAEAINQQNLRVIPAYYDFESGEVTFSKAQY